MKKTLEMALKPHKHDNKSIQSWIKMEIPLKKSKRWTQIYNLFQVLHPKDDTNVIIYVHPPPLFVQSLNPNSQFHVENHRPQD